MMHRFDTETVTKYILEKVAEVIGNDGALLTNQLREAKFPVCVVQPPIQSPRHGGAALDLSITVEVWADTQYEAMRVFDQIRDALAEINLTMTNNTPLFQDAYTLKWRFGGYFETRWNAIINAFEINR